MTGTGSTVPAGAGEDLLRRHRGETVLITGASSGIGRELARQFAGDGADLVLIARSEDRLRDLAGELTAEYGVTVEVVPADLSQPGSPDQIVETLARQQTDVDVLVNNAGFGARGPVAGLGVQRQLEMIGPPAVSGRREPGIDGLAQGQQVSRHWVASHHATQSALA